MGKKLTPEQRQYIFSISLREDTGGSIVKTIEEFYVKYGFRISRYVVGKIQNQGRSNHRKKLGGKRTQLSNNEIGGLYKKCNGNFYEMAKQSGMKPETLESRCIKLGLKQV